MSSLDGVSIPKEKTLETSIGIIREGFGCMPNRFRRYGTDLFQTRLMGQRTVCIHGSDTARLFYDQDKLRCGGAIPRRVVTSLFGKKAVHMLDD